MTRAQKNMKQAHCHVAVIRRECGVSSDSKDSRRYGGLCHAIPVMIRTCGLCQAVAFLESKAKPGNGDERLLGHIADLLGMKRNGIHEAIAGLSSVEYMLKTRLLLDALVYYKRFAVSILKAEADAADEGGTPQ